MSHLLMASATAFEIAPLLKHFKVVNDKNPAHIQYGFMHHRVDVLITGVGMVNMAFAMGQVAGSSFDIAINPGICGSFSTSLPSGSVVHVTTDMFSELGAEDGRSFLTLEQLNLGTSVYHALPYETPFLKTLPRVKGITVNTVHGRDESIAEIVDRLHPDVETMEGAAFLMAVSRYNIPGLQIKAVSNMVERRNRDSWDIPTAIARLNESLLTILKEIE
ncbi:MAG: futalosine hydrolase [Bacteroidetes bacterium]|nr:futalosine hydrolase [Bacteroidota bacterium]